jgi:hypothetical protein
MKQHPYSYISGFVAGRRFGNLATLIRWRCVFDSTPAPNLNYLRERRGMIQHLRKVQPEYLLITYDGKESLRQDIYDVVSEKYTVVIESRPDFMGFHTIVRKLVLYSKHDNSMYRIPALGTFLLSPDLTIVEPFNMSDYEPYTAP